MSVTRKRLKVQANMSFSDIRTRTILNETRDGKTNNGGEVTLTASSATTTLADALINSNSVILFNPCTANAKAEGLPWYDDADLSPGSVTLHHTNNAQTDRRYKYTVNC